MNKTLNENYLLKVCNYKLEQMPEHNSYLKNSIGEIEKNVLFEKNLPNFELDDQVNLYFITNNTKIIFKPLDLTHKMSIKIIHLKLDFVNILLE